MCLYSCVFPYNALRGELSVVDQARGMANVAVGQDDAHMVHLPAGIFKKGEVA